MSEQAAQLPLEYPTYTHYTITLAKGAVGEMTTVRTHTAKDVDAAVNLIEGLRDASAGRDGVTWQHEEVDERGVLYGLASGGIVWEISVVPPLSETLTPV